MTTRVLLVIAALMCAMLGNATSARAQGQSNWTQAGMLTCTVDPSIGFLIFGHQSMRCRFVQNPPLPPQLCDGC